jgi:hypothetical protein
MNKMEIRDFKKFLDERNILLMFSHNYRQSRLTANPPTMEEYLQKVKAESVIPMAFVYPKSVYGKDFWLSIHEEWNLRLTQRREEHSAAEQLDSLDLEIIDIKSRKSCMGLPRNTCSLSLKGGNRLTLNMEHSRMVAKKLSTHMLLTRSRQTTDVVLMFNRTKGIEVKFRTGSSSLQFNNAELACHLVELLELDAGKDYFHIGIELLAETKDYLLFMLKKIEN